jgi:hypothetical protein
VARVGKLGGETLADYSCGGSPGIQVRTAMNLAPDSRFNPRKGTINGAKFKRLAKSPSSKKTPHLVQPQQTNN